MLKLNAGFSRKIGEANYGSRGASVNVELELDSSLIGDPDALCSRIKNLFDLARHAVDEELAADVAAAGAVRTAPGNGQRSPTNGRDNHAPRREQTRSATVSQLRAIRAICDRQQLDADLVANERFCVEQLEELTLQEASSLIEDLKSTTTPSNSRPTGGQRGGER